MFEEGDEMLMKMGEVFDGEKIGVVAGVKGDLVVVSLGSQLFNLLIDGGLYVWVVYKNDGKAVFEHAL